MGLVQYRHVRFHGAKLQIERSRACVRPIFFARRFCELDHPKAIIQGVD
jgi:hypothetical protein